MQRSIQQQHRRGYRFAIASAATAAMLLPAWVSAQVEEIVVTAQKREESLQEVPVAVTAYSGEALESWGISDASEVVFYTPSLASAQQNGSNRSYFLRGVGTFDFHLTAASAVGQYYDGITLTSGFQARAALYDIERVEVLKGPQNTLFGLNTTGGAVNYIPKQPEIGAGLQGTAEVRTGSDGMFGVDAAVGVDFGSNLAARFALRTESYDGPFESTVDGRGYGGQDLTTYRASLLWEPADRTSIQFTLHSSADDNQGSAVKAVGTRQTDTANINTDPVNPANPNSLPTNMWGIERCDGFVDTPIDFGTATSCVGRGNPSLGTEPMNPSAAWKTVTQDLGLEDTSTSGFFVKVKQGFNFADLDVNLAMDSIDVKTAIDGDGGPTVLLALQQEEQRDIFQTEARLTSNDTEASLRWIAGLFYLSYDSDGYTGVTSPGFTGGNRPNVGATLASVQLANTKDNLGLYGQLEYDILDSLTLTAGLRWSDEEIVGNYLPSSPAVTAAELQEPLFVADVERLVRDQFVGRDGYDANGYEIARQVSRTLTNSDIGYTFKLDWKATENSLVYASISKGFKGSALDIRAVYALVPINNVIAGLEETQLDPESLDALEVGYKASFLSDRIVLDLAWFNYQYHNLQQFVTASGVPTLDNAPESEISGFDGNLRYANSTGLYIDLGFSVLDAEVTDIGESSFVTGALGHAPDLSWSLLVSNDWSLGNSLLTLTGGLSHTGEHSRGTRTNSTSNVEGLYTEPTFTLANVNLAYRFGSNQQYRAGLAIENLTDENFCGLRQPNDGNNLVGDGFSRFGLHYNVVCRTTRAATQTFELSFGLDF